MAQRIEGLAEGMTLYLGDCGEMMKCRRCCRRSMGSVHMRMAPAGKGYVAG